MVKDKNTATGREGSGFRAVGRWGIRSPSRCSLENHLDTKASDCNGNAVGTEPVTLC